MALFVTAALVVILAISTAVFIVIDLFNYEPSRCPNWFNRLIVVLVLPLVIAGNTCFLLYYLVSTLNIFTAYDMSYDGLWGDIVSCWHEGY